MHRRTFAAIEQTELNSRAIDGFSHQSAKCINLTNNLTFGNSTDGRIATHLADSIKITCKQSHTGAKSSCSRSSLRSGMACSDDDYVVLVSIHFLGVQSR